ncbi:MAG: hypothetical protein KKE65_04700, partial [Actinobacteria bacterium]|nr:hypothetical protein [Actinomycetota bacterium]
MTTRSTEQGGVLPTAHRSSLTVLVLDDAPAGRELIERALGWVEAGLLSDFAWVTPGSIDRGGYGPVTVRAFMAARGPADPIDLLGLLSERDVRILRVVVVSLLSHADHDITRLAAACNDVSAAVERAMPIALSGRAPLHLVRINLLVPESDLEGVSPSCLQPRWDVNCVVSPEDRPDVDRMSVLVRSETNLVAHGLSAACNVGALWADMHMGPFDDIPASSNQHPDDVFVLRGQVRSIVGTNRALQLTAAAMTLVADEVDAVVEASPWGYPSTDPGRLVERASAAVLDQPDWSVVRPPDPPAESRDIGVGTLVRDWCLFQLKLPLFALGVVGRRVVVAVEDAVTDAVVGS